MSRYEGYACINEGLNNLPKSQRVTTNRSITKKTFQERGINYCSELALQNVQDLYKLLNWNYQHSVQFFRMSSSFLPWASEYDIQDLPHFQQIYETLAECGEFARIHQIRLTSHPDHFVVLSSKKPEVVESSIKELEIQGLIFDIMGLEKTTNNKINIHVGGVYGDKIESMKRFCENFQKLSHSVQSRLTVENDDKMNGYTIQDLFDGIYSEINVPIVFDFQHNWCNSSEYDSETAFLLAKSTWTMNTTPVVHYSEPKYLEDPKDSNPRKHSDICHHHYPDWFRKHNDVDVMFEAKRKEVNLVFRRMSALKQPFYF